MGQFSLDLSRAVAKAKGRTELVVKRTVLELFSKVIYKSAVDTGRFKGAWVSSQGSYSATPPTTLDKSGSATVGRMRAAVMAMPLNGSTIYLTNAVPYSLILEYGRANGQPGSMQMPQGVVRITLAELTAHYGT